MLYVTCHTKPVRPTEHLRGIRKSERRKCGCDVGAEDRGGCPLPSPSLHTLHPRPLGTAGFQRGGGGGQQSPQKLQNLGAGGGGKGSIDRTIDQLL